MVTNLADGGSLTSAQLTIPDAGAFGGARPLRVLRVPRDRKPGEKLPLIVLLHGYGADGPSQDHVMGLAALVDTERFIEIAPDGTMDSAPNHFWNATDTCCNFENSKVDDVGYLRSLVHDIDSAVGVDLTRVYAVGHSNGGSMAMRLACDASDVFAAVVSVAGPGFEDASKCAPTRAVSVRHMHGTRDGLVPYGGGPIPPLGGHHPKGTFPSATAIASMWSSLEGCGADGEEIGDLDLDDAVPGDESHVRRFPHCKGGAVVELVTMDHVGHFLWKPTPLFARTTWDFLKSHHVAPAR